MKAAYLSRTMLLDLEGCFEFYFLKYYCLIIIEEFYNL